MRRLLHIVLVVGLVWIAGCTSQGIQHTSLQAGQVALEVMSASNGLAQLKTAWPAAKKSLLASVESGTYSTEEKDTLSAAAEEFDVAMDRLTAVLEGNGGAAILVQHASDICNTYANIKLVYADAKIILSDHLPQLSAANRVRLRAFDAQAVAAGKHLQSLCTGQVGSVPTQALLDLLGAGAGLVSLASSLAQ